MTKEQAKAVNILAAWILNRNDHLGDPVDEGAAKYALMVLADHAHKTLGIGVDRILIDLAWKGRQ